MAERVFGLADETISLGDYVLTGGELAALVVIDSVVENLKRSKAERISKLWLQMPSFWKIGSKHSVKLTYGAYASQKQPRSRPSGR